MPELPEVETVRRTLARNLTGAHVRAVELRRPDVCSCHDDRAPTPRSLLVGLTIDRLRRHGKQLAIISRQGRVLCVHLGMTGQLLLTPSACRLPRRDHLHVLWSLDTTRGPCTLVFRDPRRFGGLCSFPSFDALVQARWSLLGPDALDLTPDHLHAALSRTRRPVKAALLDQRVAAGIGNIYADEALFHAAIAPTRPGASLDASEHARLALAIRAVLRAAIRRRGASLRDFVDPHDRPGRSQEHFCVYGRAGQPCFRCRTILRSCLLAQRTTVWCPVCQH